MPAARSEGRAQICAGHVRQGKTQETSSAESPSKAKIGTFTVATGTAEKTAVPPRTWSRTPTRASASQPASKRAQLGRGARGSSASSKTTASVAAVPPAIAVRTTFPASSAAMADVNASSEMVASCHVRGCSVSISATGAATIKPKARLAASIRMSKAEP